MPSFPRLLSPLVFLLLIACSKSASDLTKEGLSALKNGQVDAAVVTLKSAVQLAPDSLEARMALAQANERAGKLADAEQQYRHALELGGDPNVLIPQIAILLLDRFDTAKLLKDFGKEKLKDARADAELRASLATAYMVEKQLEQAKTLLSPAEPTPYVRAVRAHIAVIEGRKSESQQQIEALLQEKELPWNVLRVAARVQAMNGLIEQSQTTLSRALEAAPENVGLQTELAESYLGTGKTDAVRAIHAKLMRVAPTHFRTMFIDAYLKFLDGKEDEAHAQAARTLALIPDFVPALIISGRIELKRGEFASAEARARKAVQVRDDLVEGYHVLTQALLQQRKFQEAADITRRGLSRFAEDATLQSMQAEVLWSSGKGADAIRMLQKVDAATVPARPEIAIRLADWQFAMGSKPEAAASLRRASALAGADERLGDRIFQVAFRAGQYDFAKSIADEAVKKTPTRQALIYCRQRSPST